MIGISGQYNCVNQARHQPEPMLSILDFVQPGAIVWFPCAPMHEVDTLPNFKLLGPLYKLARLGMSDDSVATSALVARPLLAIQWQWTR